MSKAQRRHGRKRVQNVAHGAQADHKQAKVGLCLQSSVQFSHRERNQSEAGSTFEGLTVSSPTNSRWATHTRFRPLFFAA